MAGELLLDTGGLVSLLDRSQHQHVAFTAEDIGTNLVLTTDHRDFSVYGIGGRREFTLLPPT